MWKLIIFAVTALGTYGLITAPENHFTAGEQWFIFSLIAFHVYKYVWLVIINAIIYNKRNKVLQFYQSLSKKEKDAAEKLWNLTEFWIKNAPYKELSTDFDTLRKKLKKEVTKENANSAIRAKAAKDLKEKNSELARQKKNDKANYRKQFLTKEYGAENAKKILQKKVWQGMNKAMLNESIGRPVKKQEQIHKTTVKNNFFYNSRKTRQGNEKPTFRVDLENNTVVGWKDLE